MSLPDSFPQAAGHSPLPPSPFAPDGAPPPLGHRASASSSGMHDSASLPEMQASAAHDVTVAAQPSLAAAGAAADPSAPHTPVSSHAVTPTTLEKQLEILHKMEKENDTNNEVYKKGLSDAKTQKIRYAVMFSVGVVLALAGVTVLAAAAPATGALVVGIGCCLVGGYLFKRGIDKWSVPAAKTLADDKSQLDTFKKNSGILTEAAKRLEDHKDFGAFLAHYCPMSEEDPALGPKYKVEDIENCLKLFDIQIEANEKDAKVAPLESAVKELSDDVTDKQSALKGPGEELQKLAQGLAAFETSIGATPTTPEQLQVVGGRVALINPLGRENKELLEDNAKLNKENAELEATNKRLETENEQLKKNGDALRAAHARLNQNDQNAIAASEVAMASNDTEIATRDSTIADNQATIMNNRTAIDANVTAIGNNEYRIGLIGAYARQLIIVQPLELALQKQQAKLDSAQAALQKENTAWEDLQQQFKAQTEFMVNVHNAADPLAANVPDNRGLDARLKYWKDVKTPFPAQNFSVNFNAPKPDEPGSPIYAFGRLSETFIHGEGLNSTQHKALGYTEGEYNYLSNSYEKALTIDGKTYKSVTQYLMLKKLDKLMAAEKAKPQPLKRKIKRFELIRKNVSKENTKLGLSFFTQHYRDFYLYNPEEGPKDNYDPHGEIFNDMDAELKEALFHKFVGPDGTLTIEGAKLLKTGEDGRQLYAGGEPGDHSFGVQLTCEYVQPHKKINISGQNKLGVLLMELRERLDEDKKPIYPPGVVAEAAAPVAGGAPPPAPVDGGPVPAVADDGGAPAVDDGGSPLPAGAAPAAGAKPTQAGPAAKPAKAPVQAQNIQPLAPTPLDMPLQEYVEVVFRTAYQYANDGRHQIPGTHIPSFLYDTKLNTVRNGTIQETMQQCTDRGITDKNEIMKIFYQVLEKRLKGYQPTVNANPEWRATASHLVKVFGPIFTNVKSPQTIQVALKELEPYSHLNRSKVESVMDEAFRPIQSQLASEQVAVDNVLDTLRLELYQGTWDREYDVFEFINDRLTAISRNENDPKKGIALKMLTAYTTPNGGLYAQLQQKYPNPSS